MLLYSITLAYTFLAIHSTQNNMERDPKVTARSSFREQENKKAHKDKKKWNDKISYDEL